MMNKDEDTESICEAVESLSEHVMRSIKNYCQIGNTDAEDIVVRNSMSFVLC